MTPSKRSSATTPAAATQAVVRALHRAAPEATALDLALATAVRVAQARALAPLESERAAELARKLPEAPYLELGGALLGSVYEGLLSADTRRRSGAHYTPAEVASFLVAQVDERGSLVDPACGGGRFLLAAASRRGGDPGDDRVASISGTELDPQAATVAREALALDAHGGDIAHARAFWAERITTGDALSVAHGLKDAVVGNPPYFAALGHPELQSLGKKRFPRVYSGRNDISHFFTALAVELLRENGRLALVLPAYFRDNTFARPLREFLAAELRDLELYDLGNHALFSAQVHTVLLVATRGGGPARTTLRLGPPDGGREDFRPTVRTLAHTTSGPDVLRSLAAAAATGAPPSAFLHAENEPADFLARMAEHPPLASLANIEKGCETGRNDIFVLDDARLPIVDLEPGLLRPVLKGRHVRAFRLAATDSHMLYLDGRQPLAAFPRTAAYLTPFRAELERRADCRDGLYPWWRLHRPRSAALAQAPSKVVAPYRTAIPVFAVDERGCLNDGGDVRFIVPNAGVDAHYLCGILNSAAVAAWLTWRGKRKGGLFELFLEPLARIPIPAPEHPLAPRIAALARALAGRAGAPAKDEAATLLQRRNLDTLAAQAYGVSSLDGQDSTERPPR